MRNLPQSAVAIVTNIPAPYRISVFSRLPRKKFKVFFFSSMEKNRSWKINEMPFDYFFLKGYSIARRDGFNFIHINISIFKYLTSGNYSQVIVSSLNPTGLFAIIWALVKKRKYIYMTDGTLLSEGGLGIFHKTLRRIVFAKASAFIVASLGGRSLIQSYGVPVEKIFISRLCADNESHIPTRWVDKDFDVMFCGRLHETKMPLFFLDVCAELYRRMGRLSVLVVGDGPARDAFLCKLKSIGLDYHYAGFIQPSKLPELYSKSKLFLFTTKLDAWGVVANEAMASGVPVITTPYAGVANDLVIDGVNGRVIEPLVGDWADACQEILVNRDLWETLSRQALIKVSEFTYDAAALGLLSACSYVENS